MLNVLLFSCGRAFCGARALCDSGDLVVFLGHDNIRKVSRRICCRFADVLDLEWNRDGNPAVVLIQKPQDDLDPSGRYKAGVR